MQKLILTALQKKLRVQTTSGNLSLEQLIELPLTSTTGKANLIDLAKDYAAKVKPESVLDFLTTPVVTVSSTDKQIFEILKIIIIQKQEDAAVKSAAKANSDRKEYLQKLIAEKKGEADKSKSLEELVAELSKL